MATYSNIDRKWTSPFYAPGSNVIFYDSGSVVVSNNTTGYAVKIDSGCSLQYAGNIETSDKEASKSISQNGILFSGVGALSFTAVDGNSQHLWVDSTENSATGIYAKEGLNITGNINTSEISVKGNSSSSTTVTADFDASAYGIHAQSINVSGGVSGSISVSSYGSAKNVIGIAADSTLSFERDFESTATIQAILESGTFYGENLLSDAGVFVTDFLGNDLAFKSISGSFISDLNTVVYAEYSNFTGTSTEQEEKRQQALSASNEIVSAGIYGKNNVTIISTSGTEFNNSSTVTFKGSNSNKTQGTYGIAAKNDLTITNFNSTVSIESTTDAYSASGSNIVRTVGLYAGNNLEFSSSDGNINVTSLVKTGGYSITATAAGIYAGKNVEIETFNAPISVSGSVSNKTAKIYGIAAETSLKIDTIDLTSLDRKIDLSASKNSSDNTSLTVSGLYANAVDIETIQNGKISASLYAQTSGSGNKVYGISGTTVDIESIKDFAVMAGISYNSTVGSDFDLDLAAIYASQTLDLTLNEGAYVIAADGKSLSKSFAAIEARKGLTLTVNGLIYSDKSTNSLDEIYSGLAGNNRSTYISEALARTEYKGYAIRTQDSTVLNVNDTVTFGKTAVVIGNIELGGGENIITIDSSAHLYGYINSDTGSTNIQFNLTAAAMDDAIIKTGVKDTDDSKGTEAAGDLESELTAYAVDINESANGTYTLIESTLSGEKWAGRELGLFVDNTEDDTFILTINGGTQGITEENGTTRYYTASYINTDDVAGNEKVKVIVSGSAPTGKVSGVKFNDTSSVLSWDSYSANTVGYTIRYYTDSADKTMSVYLWKKSDGSLDNSFDFSNLLKKGEEYQFEVLAVLSNGTQTDWSDVYTDTMEESVSSSSLVISEVVRSGENDLYIDWGTNSFYNNAVAYYTVEIRKGTQLVASATVNADVISKTTNATASYESAAIQRNVVVRRSDGEAFEAGTYTVTVTACDKGGSAIGVAQENSVSIGEFEDDVVQTPQSLSYKMTGSMAVLQWSPAVDSNISRYVIEYSTDKDFLRNVKSITSEANEYSISGLTNYETYYWRVKAISRSSNQSDWSSTNSFMVYVNDTVGPKYTGTDESWKYTYVTPVNNTLSLTLNWNGDLEDQGSGENEKYISGMKTGDDGKNIYEIRYHMTETSSTGYFSQVASYFVTAGATSQTLTMRPGEYQVAVYAMDKAGNELESNEETITVAAKPDGLSVDGYKQGDTVTEDESKKTVTVTWTGLSKASYSSLPGSFELVYKLYYSSDSSVWSEDKCITIKANDSDTEYSYTYALGDEESTNTLKYARNYYFKVVCQATDSIDGAYLYQDKAVSKEFYVKDIYPFTDPTFGVTTDVPAEAEEIEEITNSTFSGSYDDSSKVYTYTYSEVSKTTDRVAYAELNYDPGKITEDGRNTPDAKKTSLESLKVWTTDDNGTEIYAKLNYGKKNEDPYNFVAEEDRSRGELTLAFADGRFTDGNTYVVYLQSTTTEGIVSKNSAEVTIKRADIHAPTYSAGDVTAKIDDANQKLTINFAEFTDTTALTYQVYCVKGVDADPLKGTAMTNWSVAEGKYKWSSDKLDEDSEYHWAVVATDANENKTITSGTVFTVYSESIAFTGTPTQDVAENWMDYTFYWDKQADRDNTTLDSYELILDPNTPNDTTDDLVFTIKATAEASGKYKVTYGSESSEITYLENVADDTEGGYGFTFDAKTFGFKDVTTYNWSVKAIRTTTRTDGNSTAYYTANPDVLSSTSDPATFTTRDVTDPEKKDDTNVELSFSTDNTATITFTLPKYEDASSGPVVYELTLTNGVDEKVSLTQTYNYDEEGDNPTIEFKVADGLKQGRHYSWTLTVRDQATTGYNYADDVGSGGEFYTGNWEEQGAATDLSLGLKSDTNDLTLTWTAPSVVSGETWVAENGAVVSSEDLKLDHYVLAITDANNASVFSCTISADLADANKFKFVLSDSMTTAEGLTLSGSINNKTFTVTKKTGESDWTVNYGEDLKSALFYDVKIADNLFTYNGATYLLKENATYNWTIDTYNNYRDNSKTASVYSKDSTSYDSLLHKKSEKQSFQAYDITEPYRKTGTGDDSSYEIAQDAQSKNYLKLTLTCGEFEDSSTPVDYFIQISTRDFADGDESFTITSGTSVTSADGEVKTYKVTSEDRSLVLSDLLQGTKYQWRVIVRDKVSTTNPGHQYTASEAHVFYTGNWNEPEFELANGKDSSEKPIVLDTSNNLNFSFVTPTVAAGNNDPQTWSVDTNGNVIGTALKFENYVLTITDTEAATTRFSCTIDASLINAAGTTKNTISVTNLTNDGKLTININNKDYTITLSDKKSSSNLISDIELATLSAAYDGNTYLLVENRKYSWTLSAVTNYSQYHNDAKYVFSADDDGEYSAKLKTKTLTGDFQANDITVPVKPGDPTSSFEIDKTGETPQGVVTMSWNRFEDYSPEVTYYVQIATRAFKAADDETTTGSDIWTYTVQGEAGKDDYSQTHTVAEGTHYYWRIIVKDNTDPKYKNTGHTTIANGKEFYTGNWVEQAAPASTTTETSAIDTLTNNITINWSKPGVSGGKTWTVATDEVTGESQAIDHYELSLAGTDGNTLFSCTVNSTLSNIDFKLTNLMTTEQGSLALTGSFAEGQTFTITKKNNVWTSDNAALTNITVGDYTVIGNKTYLFNECKGYTWTVDAYNNYVDNTANSTLVYSDDKENYTALHIGSVGGKFTTADITAPVDPGAATQTSAFELTGTETKEPQVTLSWEAFTDTSAVSYKIELSTSSTFAEKKEYTVESGKLAYLLPSDDVAQGTHYYWRVIATDATGLDGHTTTGTTREFYTGNWKELELTVDSAKLAEASEKTNDFTITWTKPDLSGQTWTVNSKGAVSSGKDFAIDTYTLTLASGTGEATTVFQCTIKAAEFTGSSITLTNALVAGNKIKINDVEYTLNTEKNGIKVTALKGTTTAGSLYLFDENTDYTWTLKAASNYVDNSKNPTVVYSDDAANYAKLSAAEKSGTVTSADITAPVAPADEKDKPSSAFEIDEKEGTAKVTFTWGEFTDNSTPVTYALVINDGTTEKTYDKVTTGYSIQVEQGTHYTWTLKASDPSGNTASVENNFYTGFWTEQALSGVSVSDPVDNNFVFSWTIPAAQKGMTWSTTNPENFDQPLTITGYNLTISNSADKAVFACTITDTNLLPSAGATAEITFTDEITNNRLGFMIGTTAYTVDIDTKKVYQGETAVDGITVTALVTSSLPQYDGKTYLFDETQEYDWTLQVTNNYQDYLGTTKTYYKADDTADISQKTVDGDPFTVADILAPVAQGGYFVNFDQNSWTLDASWNKFLDSTDLTYSFKIAGTGIDSSTELVNYSYAFAENTTYNWTLTAKDSVGHTTSITGNFRSGFKDSCTPKSTTFEINKLTTVSVYEERSHVSMKENLSVEISAQNTYAVQLDDGCSFKFYGSIQAENAAVSTIHYNEDKKRLGQSQYGISFLGKGILQFSAETKYLVVTTRGKTTLAAGVNATKSLEIQSNISPNTVVSVDGEKRKGISITGDETSYLYGIHAKSLTVSSGINGRIEVIGENAQELSAISTRYWTEAITQAWAASSFGDISFGTDFTATEKVAASLYVESKNSELSSSNNTLSVFAGKTLTFNGWLQGDLGVEFARASAANSNVYGLYASDTVNLVKGSKAAITLNSAIASGSGNAAYAIYAKTLLTSAELSGTITETVSNGTTYGIYSATIDLDKFSSTLTVENTTTGKVYALYAGTALEIDTFGGVVTARANGGDANGIYAQTITLGTYSATLNINNTEAVSYGIYAAKTIAIAAFGGSMTVNSAGNASYGICAAVVDIESMTGTLTVTGGLGCNTFGVYASTAMNMTLAADSKLYAYNATGENAYGIVAEKGLNLTVNGLIYSGKKGAKTTLTDDELIANSTVAVNTFLSGTEQNIDDSVYLGRTATVYGDIDLYAGANLITIESGAKLYGHVSGDHGYTNLRFILDDTNNGVIISTDSIGSLDDTDRATYAIDLMEMKEASAVYTLIEKSGADLNASSWSGRSFGIYNNKKTGTLRVNGGAITVGGKSVYVSFLTDETANDYVKVFVGQKQEAFTETWAFTVAGSKMTFARTTASEVTADVKSYTIRYRKNDSDDWKYVANWDNKTSIDFTDACLTDGVIYQFQVMAVKTDGTQTAWKDMTNDVAAVASGTTTPDIKRVSVVGGHTGLFIELGSVSSTVDHYTYSITCGGKEVSSGTFGTLTETETETVKNTNMNFDKMISQASILAKRTDKNTYQAGTYNVTVTAHKADGGKVSATYEYVIAAADSASPLIPDYSQDVLAPTNLLFTVHGATADLSWERSRRTDGSFATNVKYILEYSTAKDFSKNVMQRESVSESILIYGLTNYEKYYWRVKAVTTDSTNPLYSDWSSTRSFQVYVKDTEIVDFDEAQYNDGNNTPEGARKQTHLSLKNDSESTPHTTDTITGAWVGTEDPFDYYAVDVTATGSYTFRVLEADDLDCLEIQFGTYKDETFKAIASQKSIGTTLSLANNYNKLEAGEDYFIKISVKDGSFSSSSYQLEMTVADNSDDTIESASTQTGLNIGDSVNDWVGFDDAVDYRKLVLARNATVRLSLSEMATPDRISLVLCDADGNDLQSGTVFDAELEAGTYYAKIMTSNADKYMSKYTFSMLEMATPNNNDDTIELASNQTGVGVGCTIDDWVGAGDAVDYHKIVLAANTSVTLSLSNVDDGVSDGIILSLYDEKGNMMKTGTELDDPVTLSAGTYYAKVLTADENKYMSKYTFSIA